MIEFFAEQYADMMDGEIKDPVSFVEDYLGVKLYWYQKVYLRLLFSKRKGNKYGLRY